MLARERKPEELVITNLNSANHSAECSSARLSSIRSRSNKEIINRLTGSLEGGDKLELSAIRADMETIWLRYSEWFAEHELEEGILTALEQRDFELAHRRAIALRETRRQRRADGQPRWRESRSNARA